MAKKRAPGLSSARTVNTVSDFTCESTVVDSNSDSCAVNLDVEGCPYPPFGSKSFTGRRVVWRNGACDFRRELMPGRILIVDDHEVVRQGIRTILKARPQWELVGEAVNGKDAVEKAQKLNPDVILMDITMPEMSGIEATREISRLKLPAGILIFTMHESKNLAETVREAGARGLVLKSHAARDLLDALETLMNGGTFFGPDASKVAEAGKERKDRGAVFCI